MNLQCQVEPLKELKLFSDSNVHNILIEGPSGCGKTYLSRQYSDFIDSDGFIEVGSTVNDIRTTIDDLYGTSSKLVLCIENLDSGVASASYSLLKFLEEPYDNIYIIVTCRNMYDVPDTIRSRCRMISVPNPTVDDINTFGKFLDLEKYEKYFKSELWMSIRTFTDIKYFYSLTDDKISYIIGLFKSDEFKGAVSDNVWKIRYFDDGSTTNVQFILKYLLYLNNGKQRRIYIYSCLDDLYKSRHSLHAILSKLFLDLKYGDLN